MDGATDKKTRETLKVAIDVGKEERYPRRRRKGTNQPGERLDEMIPPETEPSRGSSVCASVPMSSDLARHRPDPPFPSSNRSTVVGLKLYFQVSQPSGILPYYRESTVSSSRKGFRT